MAATANIPKMKLYYYAHPVYRPVRCAWLIKELGLDDKVDYKFVPVTPDPPSPELEEYRKNVHPHGTVPALEIEGGPTLLESVSICLYLADLCGQGRFVPTEPSKRAEYYDWMIYTLGRLDESLEVLGSQWWYGPKNKTDAAMARARTVVDVCLDRVERTLQDRTFILGKELTAVDCVLGFSLLWAARPEMNNGIVVKDHPNIKAYLDRIRTRPALQAALNLPRPAKQ